MYREMEVGVLKFASWSPFQSGELLEEIKLSNNLLSIAKSLSVDNFNVLKIFHGTSDSSFKPNPNHDNSNNDYGRGLYTTTHLDMAKEWSMSKYNENTTGYAYEYDIDISGLKILDLKKFDILYWIALVLQNRPIDNLLQIPKQNAKKLVEKYSIDISEYDIIRGWRADDIYFTYMKDFVSGAIYKETLYSAVHLVRNSIQYCLKSDEAFRRLKFVKRHNASLADRDMFNRRDIYLRRQYMNMQRNHVGSTTIYDILR